MNNNEQNKSLPAINEKGFFYKIKNFFKRFFGVDNTTKYTNVEIQEYKENVEVKNERNSFTEAIRIVENEETKLLKLQKQYHSGEIKESEMTQEQVTSLCDLYDKQIEKLKKSNESRKQNLLLYRNKLRMNN